jgi:CRP-like cAMP-binding protein
MGCGQSTPLAAEPATKTAGTTNATAANGTTTAPAALDMRHVRNIFAKPLQHLTTLAVGGSAGTTAPKFPKTPEETAFLRQALPRNFVFEHVPPAILETLVQSFEPWEVADNTIIIQQGDPTGDYFYVLKQGSVAFVVDGTKVGTATEPGQSFGELSLLYSAPRAATVQATSKVQLYRLDQITFRSILQQQQVSQLSERMAVLRQVQFLHDLDDYSLYKVASVATEQSFPQGTVIVHKGDTQADICYILVAGEVCCSEISVGRAAACQYENVTLRNVGDYFGERALMTGEPRAATVTAMSHTVTCYTIDKTTFTTVLGDLQAVVAKANLERTLSAIPVVASSQLSAPVRAALARGVTEHNYAAGTILYSQGQSLTADAAALYLIRTGAVTVNGAAVGAGGYCGDDQLQADVGLADDAPLAAHVTAQQTVVAGPDGVVCGQLTLAVLRTLVDTRYLGQAPPQRVRDSLVLGGGKDICLDQLPRHAVLGAGTFGMVFLVSRKNAIGERMAYAMKVQSKFELCRDGQAQAVICEKNIMSQLQHPFLAGLICSYQDDNFVYLLLQLIQGGELYSYMHNTKHDWLEEPAARFYAACIAEGLGYMHQRGYCYRDLKPENVLVDASGTWWLCVIGWKILNSFLIV